MAVTAKWFGLALNSLANKEADLNSDTIKIALFTNAAAPNQDTHQYYDAANGMTEVSGSGTGYTTAGWTLTTPSFTYTGSTNVWKFDADDVSQSGCTFTARYAEIYDSTPGSNKPLLVYIDFGADVSPVAGTFAITFDAGGIATITIS